MRRSLVLVAVVAAVLGAVAAGRWPGAAEPEPLVRAIGTIAMTVSDAERAAAFYADVLGFERVSDIEVADEAYARLQEVPGLRMRVVRMRLGAETIALMQPRRRGRPIPADSRSNDRWFQHAAIIVSDMDRAYAVLRRHGVEHVSPAPQRLPDWNPAAGGIRAFYFKDPDHHVLEILAFPPGKGDPRWQRHDGRLFLGVDHTAIVVGDTAASLRCYTGTLGLRVAGESENYGPEQERLNDVAGARLRITTLRAAAGPGIELLEYRAPRGGRPVPPDARPDDIAHWQTNLVTGDAGRLARVVRDGACMRSAPPVVTLPDRTLGARRAALFRDPDRHVLAIAEP